MTPRDESLSEITTWQAELAAIPLKEFDIDQWYSAEISRVQNLDVATLYAEWQAAERVDDAERMRQRRLEILRERFGTERGRRRDLIAGNKTLLGTTLLPPKLAEAIRRTEAETNAIEAVVRAKQIDVARITNSVANAKNMRQQGWRVDPSVETLNSQLSAASGQCAAVEMWLERARYALRKLRALVLIPGDQAAAIQEIVRERMEADIAADFPGPAVEQSTEPQPAAEIEHEAVLA